MGCACISIHCEHCQMDSHCYSSLLLSDTGMFILPVVHSHRPQTCLSMEDIQQWQEGAEGQGHPDDRVKDAVFSSSWADNMKAPNYSTSITCYRRWNGCLYTDDVNKIIMHMENRIKLHQLFWLSRDKRPEKSISSQTFVPHFKDNFESAQVWLNCASASLVITTS